MFHFYHNHTNNDILIHNNRNVYAVINHKQLINAVLLDDTEGYDRISKICNKKGLRGIDNTTWLFRKTEEGNIEIIHSFIYNYMGKTLQEVREYIMITSL